MALTVTHAKTVTIPDPTQAELDAQIALGNYPPGTTLADIALQSDWNDSHQITGVAETFANLTTSTTLTAANNNTVFRNTGASGLVIVDLFAAADETKLTFIVTNANGFKLDAAGADVIVMGSNQTSAGGTITCTQRGGAVTLYGESGAWYVVSSMRTWGIDV